MRVSGVAVVLLLLISASACSNDGPVSADMNSGGTAESRQTDLQAESENTEPRYFEKDGSDYIYQAAISEDQRDAGQATPDLHTYRFLGKEGDAYTLAVILNGEIAGHARCKNPCKIIKVSTVDGEVDQMAYAPESVIGLAFQDAFDGHLQVAGASKS